MSFHQLISMAAGGRMHCPIEGNVRETPAVSAVEGKRSALHRTGAQYLLKDLLACSTSPYLFIHFYSLSCPFAYETKLPYLITTAFHVEYPKNKINFS